MIFSTRQMFSLLICHKTIVLQRFSACIFFPYTRNIMNEYYARDISKKRRIVNKMKGNSGVPLSPPPYGYIKNPDDPRFWVVDPEAAAIVRRIYQMADRKSVV